MFDPPFALLRHHAFEIHVETNQQGVRVELAELS